MRRINSKAGAETPSLPSSVGSSGESTLSSSPAVLSPISQQKDLDLAVLETKMQQQHAGDDIAKVTVTVETSPSKPAYTDGNVATSFFLFWYITAARC